MTAPPPRRARIRALATTAAVALLAGTGAAFTPGISSASSHREAPLIAADPPADNTDVYAFVPNDHPDRVTLIGNWYPFEEPNGGPNFYPFATNAHYDIHIDNNGDGVADVTYQWAFNSSYRNKSTFLYDTGPVTSLTDKDLNFRQTYTLTKIVGSGPTAKQTVLINNATVAPSFTGHASMPHYGKLRSQATHSFGRGRLSYAGQADDPFFLDLRIFDLLYGTDLSEAGHDTLNGYNVNTIALQVPKADVTLGGQPRRNPVIGVWATTERQASRLLMPGSQQQSGPYVQVSRLGNPLVNEAVVPLSQKDKFNGMTPDQDHSNTAIVNKVLTPIVPQLVQKIYGIKAPATPRKDLAEIFLTGLCKTGCGPIHANLNSQSLNKGVNKANLVPSEELRLNTAIKPTAHPNRLGVLGGDLQGYPNGRRLTDDVVDIEIQALEGAAKTGKLVKALAAGDGVNVNDRPFTPHFPYVALPNETSVSHASNGSQGAAFSPSANTDPHNGFPATPVAIALLGLLLAGLAFVGLRPARTRRPVVT